MQFFKPKGQEMANNLNDKREWTTENVQDAVGPKVKVSTKTTVTISESERRKEILRLEMDRILFWE